MHLVALVRRSIGRTPGVLAGLAALLTAMQLLFVIVAASQQQSQSFNLLARLAPAFVQRQFGSALPMFLSFGGLVTFGFFHPVVVLTVALAAAFLASELAADVEGGQVDLLLSRPLARHWLVTRSLVLVLSAPMVLVLLMIAASRLALGVFAPEGAIWPSLGTIGLMGAHLAAIAWCFGTFGLAIAAMVKRRVSALGPAAIGAVAFYLLDVLAGAWQPIAPAALLSPFHYYQGTSVLAGTASSTRDLLVLGSMSLVSSIVAYWRFSARDL
jgi:hypothetical protein